MLKESINLNCAPVPCFGYAGFPCFFPMAATLSEGGLMASVIRVPSQDCKRPVDLLGQNHTGEFMG
jgi:hypothetical protein